MARSAPFRQRIAKPERVGLEHNVWFWHPHRCGVKFGPSSFTDRLKSEMGDELEVVWNPINERWQVWMKSPGFQSPIAQGYKLLFVHQDRYGNYLPLDERVYARLYSCSRDVNGTGKEYFARIESEYWRDKDKQEKRLSQEAIDQAMPYFEHSKIKNIGKGNKFSTYFA